MEFNNGFLSVVSNSDSKNFFGGTLKTNIPFSELTNRRINAEKDIKRLANLEGGIDKVVSRMLFNSYNLLKAYVTYKGVTPIADPTALAVQAAILRSEDIAYTAAAADVSDSEALLLIENSENESLELSMPDSEYILPADVQACIKILIEQMKEKFQESGGTGELKDFHKYVRAYMKADGFDFDPSSLVVDIIKDPAFNKWYGQDLTIEQYNNFPDSFNGKYNAYDYPGLATNPINNNNGSTFGLLDNIFNGGISDFFGGLKDKAEDTAGDLASTAFSRAIRDNMGLIILILILLFLTIYTAIYANKNK